MKAAVLQGIHEAFQFKDFDKPVKKVEITPVLFLCLSRPVFIYQSILD
jgi:hypothetical protein